MSAVHRIAPEKWLRSKDEEEVTAALLRCKSPAQSCLLGGYCAYDGLCFKKQSGVLELLVRLEVRVQLLEVTAGLALPEKPPPADIIRLDSYRAKKP